MSADRESLIQIGQILDTFIEGDIVPLAALARIGMVMSGSGAWK